MTLAAIVITVVILLACFAYFVLKGRRQRNQRPDEIYPMW